MILIADTSGSQHSIDIITAILEEYPSIDIEVVNSWDIAYSRSITDTDVTAIVRSATGLANNLQDISNISDRVCVFYTLGSNTPDYEISTPSSLYRNLITVGAGDAENQNNTAYGDGLCFWDNDLADVHPLDESSYSNGRICGKLLKIKDSLNCSWWEAIWRARKTAIRNESNRPNNIFWHKYNGFGKIDVLSAINYGGIIPPTSFYSYKTDYDPDAIYTVDGDDFLSNIIPIKKTNTVYRIYVSTNVYKYTGENTNIIYLLYIYNYRKGFNINIIDIEDSQISSLNNYYNQFNLLNDNMKIYATKIGITFSTNECIDYNLPIIIKPNDDNNIIFDQKNISLDIKTR